MYFTNIHSELKENQRCAGNKYCRIVASFINVYLIELQDFYLYFLDYHDTICPGLGQPLRRPDLKIVDRGRAND